MRMKKWQICLLVSFIFFQQINAKVQTRKLILLNTAKSLDIESRASYSDALIKAKENFCYLKEDKSYTFHLKKIRCFRNQRLILPTLI